MEETDEQLRLVAMSRKAVVRSSAEAQSLFSTIVDLGTRDALPPTNLERCSLSNTEFTDQTEQELGG